MTSEVQFHRAEPPTRWPPSPPPGGSLFVLRVDGEAVDLEEPSATVDSTELLPTYVEIAAEEPRSGDRINGASITLNEPFATGTFDCTPDENGDWVNKRATVSSGEFFGFLPRQTGCTVTVTFISADRAAGTFSVKAHAPDGSTLGGKVSTAEGEFDVPIEKVLTL